MELHELQHAFMRAVYEKQTSDGLSACLKESTVLGAKQGVAIYQDSFKGNLINCLVAAYPVCMRLVGEQYFFALANRFIVLRPHQQPSLASYGNQFADFLSHFEPVQRALPYLSDVARLEWAYHLAFDSPEYDVLDSVALSKLSDKQHMRILFKLPPASTLIYSDFPIYTIWEMNQPECMIQTEINLQSGAQRLFVFRDNWHIHVHTLCLNEFEMLTQIQQGKCFADVCEYLVQQAPAVEISQIFANCIKRKWLASFSLL